MNKHNEAIIPMNIYQPRKTNMNSHILQSTPSVRFISFILLISLEMLSGITQAGNLRIEPSKPIIAVGESISLSVFGADGEIIWQQTQAGTIMLESNPHRATYTAPQERSLEWYFEEYSKFPFIKRQFQ